jgi:hypothetical protein
VGLATAVLNLVPDKEKDDVRHEILQKDFGQFGLDRSFDFSWWLY